MLCKLASLYSHHIPLVLHEVHSSCVSPPENLCLPPFLISVWRMETMFYSFLSSYAYPDGSEAKLPANAGDMGLIPGSGRSPGGGGKWQPTPVFLPGESHEQKNLLATVPGVEKNRT